MNINSFSQLIDNDSSDFKGTNDFIHVLQLADEDDQKQHLLESMETVQS